MQKIISGIISTLLIIAMAATGLFVLKFLLLFIVQGLVYVLWLLAIVFIVLIISKTILD
jgi:hypothetical protein